ncbi:unnamed protein product [Linum trigynum]|uniref:Uncharacterized protein n=1 Tax=Linum trigynum TaxID=586398 RepID=A0AAV2FQC0_9ROSI
MIIGRWLFVVQSAPLLFLLVVSSSFFTTSDASNIDQQIQEWTSKYKDLLAGMKQDYSGSKLAITNMTLAAERTRRRDPLDGCHYYTGGWNYEDKHYWASVAFAALPLVIIAGVWFLSLWVFLCCAFLRCCCAVCCGRKKRRGNPRSLYNASLAILLISTIVAISGSVVIYVNQHKFYDEVFDAMEYIMNKAVTILDKLKVVVNAFANAASMASNQFSLPPDVLGSITYVNDLVTSMATLPQLQSSAMNLAIHSVLFPARLALNIIVGIVIALVVLGLLFSILGIRCLVYLLAVLGWAIIVLLLILSALFLVFRIAVADACVAMEEWVRNPTTNSTMNQVLPCLNSTIADEALSVSKATVYFIVNSTNQFDNGVANKRSNLGLSYNQSGPLLPPLCNPINADMTYRSCLPGEVDIANVSEEFDKYKCQASGSGICASPGRLTPYMYDQLIAVVNVSYSLYSAGPFLAEVGQCSFVLKTLTEITDSYCPGLRRYSYRTFVGLVMISVSAMVCLVCWLCHVRAKQQLWEAKRYKSLSTGPLKPW